jgi:hypothetical protein
MIKTQTYNFNGTTPLLVSDGRMSDPLYEPAKAVKAATKRKGTEEDQRKKEDLKYQGSLYFDEKIGPYFPAKNIFSFLRDSAVVCERRITKTSIQRGVFPQMGKLKISYKGPRTMDALTKDPSFRYRFMVQMSSGTRVPEVIPKFDEWSIEGVTIQFHSGQIDADDVRKLVKEGSQFIGIGASRKWGFGRFEAVEVTS